MSFLLYYHNRSGLGKGFGLAIIYIIIRHISLVAGLIFILIRFLRILTKRSSFAYIFTGTLNISIGLICIVLFLLRDANVLWLHKCLVNMVVGIIVIADVLLIGNRTDQI